MPSAPYERFPIAEISALNPNCIHSHRLLIIQYLALFQQAFVWMNPLRHMPTIDSVPATYVIQLEAGIPQTALPGPLPITMRLNFMDSFDLRGKYTQYGKAEISLRRSPVVLSSSLQRRQGDGDAILREN